MNLTGHGVFNRGRKIKNNFIGHRRLPDIGDGLADFQRKIEFGAGETLR